MANHQSHPNAPGARYTVSPRFFCDTWANLIVEAPKKPSCAESDWINQPYQHMLNGGVDAFTSDLVPTVESSLKLKLKLKCNNFEYASGPGKSVTSIFPPQTPTYALVVP